MPYRRSDQTVLAHNETITLFVNNIIKTKKRKPLVNHAYAFGHRADSCRKSMLKRSVGLARSENLLLVNSLKANLPVSETLISVVDYADVRSFASQGYSE